MEIHLLFPWSMDNTIMLILLLSLLLLYLTITIIITKTIILINTIIMIIIINTIIVKCAIRIFRNGCRHGYAVTVVSE